MKKKNTPQIVRNTWRVSIGELHEHGFTRCETFTIEATTLSAAHAYGIAVLSRYDMANEWDVVEVVFAGMVRLAKGSVTR